MLKNLETVAAFSAEHRQLMWLAHYFYQRISNRESVERVATDHELLRVSRDYLSKNESRVERIN